MDCHTPDQLHVHDRWTKNSVRLGKECRRKRLRSPLDQVRITISDREAPDVTEFSVPSTSGGLTVAISRFAATDNNVVAGYMVTANPFRPAWSSPKWSATPPATFTFSTTGAKTLYPWVRDAAGHVSRRFTGTAMKVRIAIDAERGVETPEDKD
jgi:hypothetical protein